MERSIHGIYGSTLPFCNSNWSKLLSSLAGIDLQLASHLLIGQDQVQITHHTHHILQGQELQFMPRDCACQGTVQAKGLSKHPFSLGMGAGQAVQQSLLMALSLTDRAPQ